LVPDDIPVPGFLRWLEDVFNDGEEYEKLPKVVPYLVLPLSAALLVLRFAQVGLRVLRGEQELLIVSHEAEDEEILFLFLMVIGLMLIGAPIAISLGFSSIVFLLMFSDTSMASVAQTLFEAFEGHSTLLAIPFFILASSFMWWQSGPS